MKKNNLFVTKGIMLDVLMDDILNISTHSDEICLYDNAEKTFLPLNVKKWLEYLNKVRALDKPFESYLEHINA